jgi:hypothetical protein
MARMGLQLLFSKLGTVNLQQQDLAMGILL